MTRAARKTWLGLVEICRCLATAVIMLVLIFLIPLLMLLTGAAAADPHDWED